MKQQTRKTLSRMVILLPVVITMLAVLLVTGCSGAAGKNTGKQGTKSPAARQEQLAASSQEPSSSQQGQLLKRPQNSSQSQSSQRKKTGNAGGKDSTVTEDGEYTSKEDVALYIHLYGHLPDNFITKSEAKKLGWDSRSGNLWDVAPGKSIGGDYYGNREGLLPEKKSRKYYECDIDYDGGFRGSKRIVYSNDGLIYYTGSHYNSFERLYGEVK